MGKVKRKSHKRVSDLENCDSPSSDGSPSLNVKHYEEPKNRKRKHELSLTNKNKSKEDGQASIASFFQKVPCPETNKTTSNENVHLGNIVNSVVQKPSNRHKKKKNTQNINNGNVKSNFNDIIKSSDLNIEILDGKENKERNKNFDQTKNAFTFMMNNRCKSIGQNSPGKELETVKEIPELQNENKQKLKKMKVVLQNWADKKGAREKKLEEVERDAVIQYKLKRRTKRLKKLLKVKKKEVNINNLSHNSVDSESDVVCAEIQSPATAKKWRMRLKITLKESSEELIPLKKSKEKAKLAPLFVNAKEIRAARAVQKQFLHSEVPNNLKKEMKKVHKLSAHSFLEDCTYQVFPRISHIKAKYDIQTLPPINLNFTNEEPYKPKLCYRHENLIVLSENTNNIQLGQSSTVTNLKKCVQLIKSENPDYPVYKVFKSLYGKYAESFPKLKKVHRKRRSKNQIHELVESSQGNYKMWTELYKPNMLDEMFGNSRSLHKFKKWLKTCLEFCHVQKRKRKHTDSSDFITSDSDGACLSETPNTVILCGPCGSGKTTSVYAICNEFHVQVLEINASSKRTGKRLLQELQEATQSHQVGKSDQQSLTNFIKKDESQHSKCLLLIEDVDVVFEQDDNFINAVSQLLISSKRPIVLTMTDSNCIHLKKIIAQYPTINFNRIKSKILATWLQIVCLVEGLYVDKSVIERLLENNKSDARNALLQFQFLIQSARQVNMSAKSLINRKKFELNDDDSPNMSWLNEECECTKSDKVNICNLKFKCDSLPLNIGHIWWGLPSLLYNNNEDQPKLKEQELKKVFNIFDTLSSVDVAYKCLNIDLNLEPVCGGRLLKDSLELAASDENFNGHRKMGCEWSHALLDGYTEIYSRSSWIPPFSTIKKERWRSKQYDSKKILLNAVPISYQIDSKIVNMDYLTSLRAIAKSEDDRAAASNKRRSRFYNYLRNLGITYNDCQSKTIYNIFYNADQMI